MSEERLVRIEDKLDRLENRFDGLHADVEVLKTDVSVLKTDVSVLKTGLTRLETKVDAGFIEVRQEFRHELGLAVELIRADIRGIPDHRAEIRQMMATGLESIRQEFEPRLRNVELALKVRKRR